MRLQGRLLGAKFAWLRNHEMTKFWPDLSFPKGYANFGGLAGGCSLRARCPVVAGMWLIEIVSSRAILLFTGGFEAVQVTNGKSGKNFTFSLIALDLDNRLRYPLVSLFFMMCLCLQIARLVQENLFDARFWGPRSVVERKIRMAEKS